MSADVRYVRTDEFTYEVKDRAGRWIGEVWHDLTAREWYAYARDDRRVQHVRFAGIARTRREATDLIIGAL